MSHRNICLVEHLAPSMGGRLLLTPIKREVIGARGQRTEYSELTPDPRAGGGQRCWSHLTPIGREVMSRRCPGPFHKDPIFQRS